MSTILMLSHPDKGATLKPVFRGVVVTQRVTTPRRISKISDGIIAALRRAPVPVLPAGGFVFCNPIRPRPGGIRYPESLL
jgi:hypothetical protein